MLDRDADIGFVTWLCKSPLGGLFPTLDFGASLTQH